MHIINQNHHPRQYGLGFNCVGCPYQANGRCHGPLDLTVYNRVDKGFVGCADPKKVSHYSDLYLNYLPSGKSNQENIEIDSRYIPQFFGRRRDRVLDLGNRIVYISLERLIKPSGHLSFTRKEDLLRILGLAPGTRVALIGTCRDITLERFWTNSDSAGSWEGIAGLGFEFVTGLSFSVYDQWPLYSQKFNQDRNHLSYDILSSLGTPCIPFLMPSTQEDFEYLSFWLSARQDIKYVAIHATSLTRSKVMFSEVVERMQKIRSLVERSLTFLVVGIAKPAQIRSLLNEFDAIILNSRPVMEAIKVGKAYDANLTSAREIKKQRDDLIIPNILAFERFCNNSVTDLSLDL